MRIIIRRQRQDMVVLAPAPAIPNPDHMALQTAASHAVYPERNHPPVEPFANASPASRLQDPAALALEAERRKFAAMVEYLLAFLEPSIRQQAADGLATMLMTWEDLETERIQIQSPWPIGVPTSVPDHTLSETTPRNPMQSSQDA